MHYAYPLAVLAIVLGATVALCAAVLWMIPCPDALEVEQLREQLDRRARERDAIERAEHIAAVRARGIAAQQMADELNRRAVEAGR